MDVKGSIIGSLASSKHASSQLRVARTTIPGATESLLSGGAEPPARLAATPVRYSTKTSNTSHGEIRASVKMYCNTPNFP